jgi:hypothetical protein
MFYETSKGENDIETRNYNYSTCIHVYIFKVLNVAANPKFYFHFNIIIKLYYTIILYVIFNTQIKYENRSIISFTFLIKLF